MSQSDFGTINPSTKSGTDLATDLNNFRTAQNTMHSGTTAPTYIATGMIWANSTTSNLIYNAYDGTDSIPVFVLDATNNVARVALDADRDTYIASATDDVMAFIVGGSVRYNLSSTLGNFLVNTRHNDSVYAYFGTGSDMLVVHTGSSGLIRNTTGTLGVGASLVQIQNASGTETQALFAQNGAVTLYYDNSVKAQTTSSGFSVTGNVIGSGNTQGFSLIAEGGGVYIDDSTNPSLYFRNDANQLQSLLYHNTGSNLTMMNLYNTDGSNARNVAIFADQGTAATDPRTLMTREKGDYRYAGDAQTGLGLGTGGVTFASIDGATVIDLVFDAVSLSSTQDWFVRIGNGAIVTSGYTSGSSDRGSTIGFIIRAGNAASQYSGIVRLERRSGANRWYASHTVGESVLGRGAAGGGYLNLPGSLDRVQILPNGGTFTSGNVGIRWWRN